MTMVRRLVEKEHSAAFDGLTSSISAIMKFSAETGDDPFVKVKGLISQLQNEALEDDTAKHSSTLETAVPSSTESVNEGHPDKICDQFSDVVLDACLTCDSKCKVASKTCVKDNMFMVTSEITVAGKLHHETVVRGVIPQLRQTDQVIDVPVVLVMQVPWVRVVAETAEIPQLLFVKKIGVIPESLSDVRGVVQNSGIDSFIDDLSSVGSQGSNRQDCQVLSHVGKQSGSIQQQQHQDSNQQQPTTQVTQENRGERGKERKGEGGKEEEGTEAEEAEREQVKKDVTGWTVVTRSKKHRKRTVQIFVKVDGGKISAMEMDMSDKVDDIAKKIPISDQDEYVTSRGRILRRARSRS